MKGIVPGLVALSLAAALAAPATAATTSKKKHRVVHQETYAAPRSDTYQEFIADKRRYGSGSWWQQMDREGRGGQGNPN